MKFDLYFLTSYLHQNFLIAPSEVTLSKNFKTDFGLNREEIDSMLEYLEGVFDLKFPAKRTPDRYEFVLDLVFYIIIYDDIIKNDNYESSLFN
ncbi:hypothetical protein GCM10011514_10300 [Emticicia aquatilis]|uniref:DUF1493 family protein n=1 Tax=Emticicia aquatilis TaxID=1537369 RepID=A0A916YK81_9BACT|nr:hypothetical protein [Emticicia aquatilis]GGD48225.1 hypothetical protein GCM10011514_10300 [Emticicia aquatilis]